MDDAAPPDAASPRAAWIVVAVLAVGLVAFAYAAASRPAGEDDERARRAASFPAALRTPTSETPNPPPTYVARPTTVSGRAHVTEESAAQKERDDFVARLTKALATAGAADKAPSEVLFSMREMLGNLLSLVPPADISDAERDIKAAIVKIEHALVPKIRDESKAFGDASSTTPQQGLAKYASAEDYVRKAIEDAKKANNKADDAAYTAIYRDLLVESDAYTKRVITPEFIVSIPWKDLLSGEMAGKWSKAVNVPGFSCRVETGTLTVSPPDAGGNIQGVIGIVDQPADDLRHFVLDMEFAVEGTVTMYAHSAPPPGMPNNMQPIAYDLQAGAGALTPGAKYTFAATYVGSDFVANVSGNNEKFTEYRPDPSWAKCRRGGIVFLIPPGASIRITRMRIKELR